MLSSEIILYFPVRQIRKLHEPEAWSSNSRGPGLRMRSRLKFLAKLSIFSDESALSRSHCFGIARDRQEAIKSDQQRSSEGIH